MVGGAAHSHCFGAFRMKLCLVVDDASVIRKIARHILESMRFTVAEAETAQQALELCRDEMPDLVLLDWQMPGSSAIETIAGIRAIRSDRRAVIVYCTTEYDSVDISRAFAAGADTFLMKPFDRQSLDAKLSEIYAGV